MLIFACAGVRVALIICSADVPVIAVHVGRTAPVDRVAIAQVALISVFAEHCLAIVADVVVTDVDGASVVVIARRVRSAITLGHTAIRPGAVQGADLRRVAFGFVRTDASNGPVTVVVRASVAIVAVQVIGALDAPELIAAVGLVAFERGTVLVQTEFVDRNIADTAADQATVDCALDLVINGDWLNHAGVRSQVAEFEGAGITVITLGRVEAAARDLVRGAADAFGAAVCGTRVAVVAANVDVDTGAGRDVAFRIAADTVVRAIRHERAVTTCAKVSGAGYAVVTDQWLALALAEHTAGQKTRIRVETLRREFALDICVVATCLRYTAVVGLFFSVVAGFRGVPAGSARETSVLGARVVVVAGLRVRAAYTAVLVGRVADIDRTRSDPQR